MKKLFVLSSLMIISSMSFGQLTQKFLFDGHTSALPHPLTERYVKDKGTEIVLISYVGGSYWFTKDKEYVNELFVFTESISTDTTKQIEYDSLKILFYDKNQEIESSKLCIEYFEKNPILTLEELKELGQKNYNDDTKISKNQTYSTYLELVKNEKPDVYKYIKISAENKWGTDYEMIKYTIENQCKGYIEFVELYSKYENHKDKKEICVNAYSKWKDGEIVDWEMVVYTIKNQLKSYGSY